jgi:hypothetical protein
MVCWLSFASERSGIHLPAGFETVIDRAGHGASGLWGRLQDLARRLGVGGGGEAATAVASNGAGRAAGVCAAGLAAVCLAGAGTGIVGPGIGAIDGGQQSAPAHQEQEPRHQRRRPKDSVVAPDARATGTAATTDTASVESPVTSASPSSLKSSDKTSTAHIQATKEPVTRTKTGVAHEEAVQVEEETSGIARAGAEAPATTPTVAGASDQGSSGSPTVVHTESASSSPASKAAAAEEFNFEK